MPDQHEDTAGYVAGPVPGSRPADMPIPNRLNTLLALSVGAALIGIIALGARTQSGLLRAGLVVAFALLFLTNFSLLHEAVHLKLHSVPRWNYVLGVLCGLLFPIPYSLLCSTHWNHHLRNRTDFERFDVIYPQDSPLKQRVLWYLALCGVWYWIIPPACLVLALGPGFLRRWLATRHARQGGIAYAEYQRLRVPLIRLETVLAALSMTALCVAFGWRSVLLFYGLGPILWSSTQYLEHAYAPRDVIHGAFNLRASRIFSALNLFRELDLTHHRNTRVPWIYLPRLTPPDPTQPGFLRHYLRTWRGPVRGVGPGPAPLTEIDEPESARDPGVADSPR